VGIVTDGSQQLGNDRPSGDGVDSAAQVRTALSRIGHRARRSNTERAHQLRGAVGAVLDGRLSEQERAAAVDAAHQLVGSAGTFGFQRASQLAGELEHFFGAAAFAVPERVQAAAQLVKDLEQELASDPTEPTEDW